VDEHNMLNVNGLRGVEFLEVPLMHKQAYGRDGRNDLRDAELLRERG
jgi:hypothetical protein